MRKQKTNHKKEILDKNRGSVIFYVLLGLVCSFLANYKDSYFQRVIDGLTDRSVSLAAILAYGGLLASVYLLNYLDNYPEKKLEHGFYLDFKLLALKKISRVEYLEYQRLGTGKLVQRIENGAQAGKSILLDFWLQLVRQLIPTVAFSVLFIWRLSRTVALVVLGSYVLVFLVANMLLKALYRIKEGILVNEERLNHFLVRGFMEMPVFRVARQFPREIRKAEKAKGEIVGAKVKMTMIHEAFFTIFALLVAALNVGILIYAWNTGLSVGSVVSLIALLDNAYTPIAIFNVLYVQYKLDRAAFRRYESFLSLRNDEQLVSGREIASCRGAIDVRGLTFRYGGRPLFDGLDLSIGPGEKVALVGESGSGKSTLLKIIAGLVKYDGGSVRIDGQELSSLRLDSLYGCLSYLSQDSSVFDGTLRENIVFDGDEPDAAILEAIDRVRLTPLYQTLEDGLETQIGERGAALSGGERQRVALARLWFERKKITILDEATSALDNLTEEAVVREATSLLSGGTVIAVAHKMGAVAHFDRLVVFREGKIAAQGSFEELLRDCPYFRELYHANEQ